MLGKHETSEKKTWKKLHISKNNNKKHMNKN